jgi:hypothetical protein
VMFVEIQVVTEREGRQAEGVGEERQRGGGVGTDGVFGRAGGGQGGRRQEDRSMQQAARAPRSKSRLGDRRRGGGRGAGGRGQAASASPSLAPAAHAESSLPHYSASS